MSESDDLIESGELKGDYMAKAFEKLGSVLDKQNFEWLQADNEEVANAVAAEVTAGGDPEAIGRYVAQQIGETRAGYVNRIKSAARHLMTQKAR